MAEFQGQFDLETFQENELLVNIMKVTRIRFGLTVGKGGRGAMGAPRAGWLALCALMFASLV
jgi:hypothetical protein